MKNSENTAWRRRWQRKSGAAMAIRHNEENENGGINEAACGEGYQNEARWRKKSVISVMWRRK